MICCDVTNSADQCSPARLFWSGICRNCAERELRGRDLGQFHIIAEGPGRLISRNCPEKPQKVEKYCHIWRKKLEIPSLSIWDRFFPCYSVAARSCPRGCRCRARAAPPTARAVGTVRGRGIYHLQTRNKGCESVVFHHSSTLQKLSKCGEICNILTRLDEFGSQVHCGAVNLAVLDRLPCRQLQDDRDTAMPDVQGSCAGFPC